MPHQLESLDAFFCNWLVFSLSNFYKTTLKNVYGEHLQDGMNADLGHHSLGEYFGASLHTPDKLSEEIVQCISSIYCKIASPQSSSAGFSVSSTSSLSSTSTFSAQNLYDTWSPRCNDGATGHHRCKGLNEEDAPYAANVEIVKICLDDGSFNYAASMLQNFR